MRIVKFRDVHPWSGRAKSGKVRSLPVTTKGAIKHFTSCVTLIKDDVMVIQHFNSAHTGGTGQNLEDHMEVRVQYALSFGRVFRLVMARSDGTNEGWRAHEVAYCHVDELCVRKVTVHAYNVHWVDNGHIDDRDDITCRRISVRVPNWHVLNPTTGKWSGEADQVVLPY